MTNHTKKILGTYKTPYIAAARCIKLSNLALNWCYEIVFIPYAYYLILFNIWVYETLKIIENRRKKGEYMYKII